MPGVRGGRGVQVQETERCWSGPVVDKVGSRGGEWGILAAEQNLRQGQLLEGSGGGEGQEGGIVRDVCSEVGKRRGPGLRGRGSYADKGLECPVSIGNQGC